MTNIELKQLRRLLFIELPEAAAYIGKYDPRTWQHGEQDTRTILLDVIQQMQILALMRLDKLQGKFNATDPNYHYLQTFEEYKAAKGTGNELMWCIS